MSKDSISKKEAHDSKKQFTNVDSKYNDKKLTFVKSNSFHNPALRLLVNKLKETPCVEPIVVNECENVCT